MEIEEEEALESLSVRNFLTARVQEINSLSQQVGASGVASSKGLAFQHVPKHMRRRAVSHNVKRLPHRIRQIHMNQIEKSSGSQQSKKPKCPSRKHRRRNSNLLQEYNRRQREHKWLETHIWHAKRFHISTKWNYKIPESPTDKGYRALYRAANKDCAMRDISFISCLQLKGPFDLISSKISGAFAPPNCNALKVSAEMYKSGSREGSLYFYKKGTYPKDYIGKVRFNWMEDDANEDEKEQALWLWVHPAHKEEILEELCSEFDLCKELKFVQQNNQTDKDEEEESMKMEVDEEIEIQPKMPKISVDKIKLEPKKLQERPTWKNPERTFVLTDLEGVFNRIRLYGPLATNILKQVLEPSSKETMNISGDTANKKQNWWVNHFYDNGNRLENLKIQKDLWTKLQSFSEVPCNSIIPLTVRDPRVLIPQKRTKATYAKSENESPKHLEEDWDSGGDYLKGFLDNLQKCSADAPLVSSEVRDKLIQEKMSNDEFSKRRAELLIPGSRIDLGDDENQIPVMLIHRPSAEITRFQNGGWDLIIPAGWTMEFWVALSYRAVRACGFRDAKHFEFESGSIHVSNEDGFDLPPDTAQGKIDEELSRQSIESSYFDLPQSKRPNFIKLGCPFPFQINWPKFLRFSNQNVEDNYDNFYVLRDSNLLKELASFVKRRGAVSPEEVAKFLSKVPESEKCIVGIRLVTVGKGVIQARTVICLPSETDFEYFKNIKEKDMDTYMKMTDGLLEPMKNDYNEEVRRESRESHQKLLAFLSKKRRKLKNRIDEKEKYDSVAVSRQFNEKMQSLWLPDSQTVLEEMTRVPIGFVTFGHESYSISKNAGLGFCTLSGIMKWILETKSKESVWNKKNIVMYRNCTDTWNYRFAQLEICKLC